MNETANEGLINDKIQLAKLYFKSKRYADALGIYNEVIALIKRYSAENITHIYKLYRLPLPTVGEVVHPKLLSVLDQRAATYEKLGQTPKALKDCQHSLQLSPIDLKAYLRLGKNYSKLKDDLKAYKIYQSGYYTINRFKQKYPNSSAINESLFENLKMNYQSLNTRLKNQKRKLESGGSINDHGTKEGTSKRQKRACLDPMDHLNFDILEIVFSHISVSNLLVCRLVSKKWYETLTTFKSLFLNVNLKTKIKANELTWGMRFLKSLPKFNLLVNQTSNMECLRILDLVVKNKLPLLSLNLINLVNYNQLIFKFDKYNFNFDFKLVNHIKLITNNSKFNDLLSLFRNLTRLELIIMNNDNDERGQIKNKQALKKLTAKPCDLKELVLINNNANTNNETLLPPFVINPMKAPMHSLTKLIVTSFDFNNVQHKFGDYLSNCEHLQTLILENNKNLSFKVFLQNSINYKSSFKLQKLIFRELLIDRPLSLNEFQMADFEIFADLQHLDLYSISLTNKGLIKLLAHAPKLRTLTLGNSNFIYFKNDIINNFHKMNLLEILRPLPHLINLSLIDLNLDNLSLQYFRNDLKQCPIRLNNLELSFNNNINGIGLLNFLSDYHQTFGLSINNLILDGIQVNRDTVSLIEAKYGIFVKNDHLRTKWRLYGLNSFVF